ncbi:hypothetical protein IV203_002356 [Nitzschia inconspicua]|uniref:Uncharacterized protein n=1 Tax=Nitzschia inconspicua TaxID=303405 RepID=A0A9K3L954_9STRA|nr:hypothetical protein IV203_002356 [Nitzschia inconspicua]
MGHINTDTFISHFFLDKESPAFSYEQMQLPADALLQDDCICQILPTRTNEKFDGREENQSKAFRVEDNARTLTELTDSEKESEQSMTSRRLWTSCEDTSLPEKLHSSILWKEPVELLNRCQAFVKAMFAVMLRGVNESNTEEEQIQRISNAAKWVVQFSWDVKAAASDPYLTKLTEIKPMVDPWRRWDLAWIAACMECQNDRTKLWLPK